MTRQFRAGIRDGKPLTSCRSVQEESTRLMRSFKSRLIAGTTLWIALGLAVSAASLSRIYKQQVDDLFEQELTGHLDELSSLSYIADDGQPALRAPLSDRRFQPVGSGFYWEMERRDGQSMRSPSLDTAHLFAVSKQAQANNPRWFQADGPNGPVHMLVTSKASGSEDADLFLAIAIDTAIIDRVVATFNDKLRFSLAVIGIGLIAAGWASITFGLYPVKRIRAALLAIHSGSSKHLPADLPAEISDLAVDVNALIDQKEQVIHRARAEADRLAHGLKTPLAILMAEGAHLKALGHTSAAAVIDEQCNRMHRQIDYQLSATRSSGAKGRAPGSATVAGPAARTVVIALSQLHQDREINFELLGLLDLVVACDPEDLDEMLGNLVENAAKWTRSEIRISIDRGAEESALIKVEDDGPGLPEEAREFAFNSRQRFDEATPGHGLGLAIVRDLAATYGGHAWIETSRFGGAAACLQLPLVRAR